MWDLNLLASLSATLCIAFLWLRRRRQSPYYALPLPPGPKPLPILGNILQMPTRSEAQVYDKWGREHGSSLIHLNIAGTPMIVINSAETANDLLERRSLIYSGRPSTVMAFELMGWHWHLAALPYGEEFRTGRRLFHREFNPQASLRFRPLQLDVTHDLLRRLVVSPDQYSEHIIHMAGTSIISVAYGMKVKPHDDPYIAAAELANRSLVAALSPGSFYVDYLPFLRYVPEWMPGAGFKAKAREWRGHTENVLNMPYDKAKKDYLDGTSTVSFVSQCLEALSASSGDKKDIASEEHAIKAAAASMFNAGVETTASIIKSAILAMLRNPEVQAKAQKELDEVIGHGNLPDFSHENVLPYVGAVVKEVMRWGAILPLGLPHLVTEEDAYNGYRIPANSIVVSNIWAMLHDENVYPNPSAFDPERFLSSDGQLDPTVPDPALALFGFGRRICPGRYMGLASIWITIASLLAAFDIEKAVDIDGSYIEPSDECIPGIVACPVPFKASIKPRSPAALAAVSATARA
ncbi:hypothetical protein PLICRDRAFT_47437 [Plicaturopsis crispa FD-325 SS-3]|uniref:Cytochrome P450 n=1 Tax=Plicaturopsis crispa FD-325 SS-3 TaxID=944288 RepID=A0A0C9T1G7_PLICR|nr:hypothetical protein PLICRDRAFT_47437 [Plicaturopsis crispa FD-325 SS-3]